MPCMETSPHGLFSLCFDRRGSAVRACSLSFTLRGGTAAGRFVPQRYRNTWVAALASPSMMGPVSELASLRKASGDEMKRKRFTEEQIIGIVQEAEASGKIREVCRLHDLTETTFYRRRSKLGGMDVP